MVKSGVYKQRKDNVDFKEILEEVSISIQNLRGHTFSITVSIFKMYFVLKLQIYA